MTNFGSNFYSLVLFSSYNFCVSFYLSSSQYYLDYLRREDKKKHKYHITMSNKNRMITKSFSSSNQAKWGNDTSTKPYIPRRRKTTLLPRGDPDLQNCIFDCEDRGTNSKKNLEHLALYAGKNNQPGGDMNFCIMQQQMINLTPPTRPGPHIDQNEQLDYKISRGEYMKHVNTLRSQLRGLFSTVWC